VTTNPTATPHRRTTPTPDDLTRLASAAHELRLRPDWPTANVLANLTTHHAARAYRDVAVALAWIATDPATMSPNRMNGPGPWWTAPQATTTDDHAPRVQRCPLPGHGSYRADNCGACRSERIAAPDDDTRGGHAPNLHPQPRGPGAAAAPAVLAKHHRPTRTEGAP